MKSSVSSPTRRMWVTAVAVLSALISFGLSGAMGQVPQTPEQKLAKEAGPPTASFSTMKDWNLKAENLSPRGHNPYYYPLEPGFQFIFENPDTPFGTMRKEIIVLEETEPFDIPGFGKFEAAVVQEEEFFDGVYYQQAYNWFAIDKTTNAMYAFGEVSWEIDFETGEKVFVGTWRVGEPDGNGIAEPGLLMPGVFNVGARYAYEAHELEAHGYTENMESGITMTVPAGTFEDCVKVREFSLIDRSDVTDKWWCKGVGEVKDTSDGELIASTGLPGTDTASIGKFHRNPPPEQTTPLVAKISGIEATEIAVKEIPGKVNSVKIERLGKFNVYAVEIISDADGGEWDVFVDIGTGKIIGTDN